MFHCVIGNRDVLKVGDERVPIWRFIEGHDTWLTSLVYAKGNQFTRPPGRWIIDCGAWSYKQEATPRWSPAACAERYAQLGHDGDIVASPDHMVLRNHDAQEEAYRIDLTLSNAREFLRLCPPNLRPIAVQHGNTVEQRIAMTAELLDMGYRHIAIGSVAGRASSGRKFVRAALEETAKLKQRQPFYLHVLGISALSWYWPFAHAGVDSYDGSSMFFSAFTAGEWLWFDGEKLLELGVRTGQPPVEITCDCSPCGAMREQGVDTRQMGSNEHNMGRAVHNVGQYLRALAYVRATPQDAPLTLFGTRGADHA
jgi:tRNA-guanine family transglycosylase